MELGQSRISAVGVKEIAAGVATKAIGQNLVNRRTDGRSGATACGAAEQSTEDRTGNDAHGITAFRLRHRARDPLDCASDATEGGGRGLSATARYNERSMATQAG
jgi:hypothetical protein